MLSTSRTSTFSPIAAAVALLAAPAAAQPSRGIVVTADGSVYFSDLVRIRKIDARGKERMVRYNAEGRTRALALARDGAIWGDQDDGGTFRAIWRMRGDGSLTYRYGPAATLAPGIGLLRDNAGCSWHAGQAASGGAVVLRKCGEGPARRMFGSAADARAFTPGAVADLAGSALAADGSFIFRQRGIVRRIAADRRVTVIARGLSPDAAGIALGPGEAVLVAEPSRRRLSMVARGLPRRTVAQALAPWRPSGVFWRSGTLYLLEFTDPRSATGTRLRVRRIAADGAEKVLAEVAAPLQAPAR